MGFHEAIYLVMNSISFKEYLLDEIGPPGMAPPMGGAPGGPPGMPPPPMGGAPGGPPGMPPPPMGGAPGMGGPPQAGGPAKTQIVKANDVWGVLEDLLKGSNPNPEKDEKGDLQSQSSNDPQVPLQSPAPGGQMPGQASPPPPGQPAQSHLMGVPGM